VSDPRTVAALHRRRMGIRRGLDPLCWERLRAPQVCWLQNLESLYFMLLLVFPAESGIRVSGTGLCAAR